jgi:hypothetical protein
MTRPFFNKERITDFDIFDRHANHAIGQAADRLAAGYPIDFQVKVICDVIRSSDQHVTGHGLALYPGFCLRIPPW